MQVMEVNSPNLMDENNEKEQKVKSTSRELTVGGDTLHIPSRSFLYPTESQH